ncbi:MAG: LysR family substrate-binding domain-containing protein [Nocardioides sp.]
MDPSPDPAGPLRVTFVTGVVPDKWARRWDERSTVPLVLVPKEQDEQVGALRRGEADMALVRLPVDRTGLHLIPLYTERPVVVVSAEHPVAAYDEIAVSDLAGEHLLQDPDDVPAWRDVAAEVRDGSRYPVPPMSVRQMLESVAADAGVVVLPMSVARVHHRKDVVAVPVTGVDETQVALVWPQDADDPRLETFIGVVRGRTVRSSRGSQEPPADAGKPRAARPGPAQASGRGPRTGKGGQRRGGQGRGGQGRRRR